MKKSRSFLFLVISCYILQACSVVAPSQERVYAEGFNEIYPSLIEWMTTVERFDNRVNNEAFDLGEGLVQSASDIFMMVDVGFPSLFSQQEWSKMTQPIVLALKADTTKITDLAFSIQAHMESLDPPENIMTYHNEIIQCLKSESSRARAIEEILVTGATSRELDTGACDNWEASVLSLRSFSSDNTP